jgi:hypothetical protein
MVVAIVNHCHIKNDDDHFFIERILNFHNLTEEDFYINIKNGYYGEEVENVLLECGRPRIDAINEQINHLLKLETLKEKLFYTLEIEYQNVLPELMDLYYSIEEVDKSLIKSYNKEYMKKNVPILEKYLKYPYPIGLVIDQGDGYRLIDGYHRFSASQEAKVLAVVGRTSEPKKTRKRSKE